ncbi:MAG: hypothetical protein FJ216_04590 [Ignavibacteria bacterium]|nr:hypothetical protein [Ignavibacteria bacterium]
MLRYEMQKYRQVGITINQVQDDRGGREILKQVQDDRRGVQDDRGGREILKQVQDDRIRGQDDRRGGRQDNRHRIFFMFGFIKMLLTVIFLFTVSQETFASDSARITLEYISTKRKPVSLSFGMGASYGSDNSLINFLQYELPYYPNIPESNKYSDFNGAFDFWGGIEYQFLKNFSIKGEYTLFSKTMNLAQYPFYDFSYINHQPYLLLSYIMPYGHSLIKIRGGGGLILSRFYYKLSGGELTYKSTGLGIKLETSLNIQISTHTAGYFCLYINQTFNSPLEDSNGNNLKAKNNSNVNLNSFSFGVRIGAEVFFY